MSGILLYMQKESQNQNVTGIQLLPYRKQSVVARAAYGYDNRYMRYDGKVVLVQRVVKILHPDIDGEFSQLSVLPGISAMKNLWNL